MIITKAIKSVIGLSIVIIIRQSTRFESIVMSIKAISSVNSFVFQLFDNASNAYSWVIQTPAFEKCIGELLTWIVLSIALFFVYISDHNLRVFVTEFLTGLVVKYCLGPKLG